MMVGVVGAVGVCVVCAVEAGLSAAAISRSRQSVANRVAGLFNMTVSPFLGRGGRGAGQQSVLVGEIVETVRGLGTLVELDRAGVGATIDPLALAGVADCVGEDALVTGQHVGAVRDLQPDFHS